MKNRQTIKSTRAKFAQVDFLREGKVRKIVELARKIYERTREPEQSRGA